LEELLGFIDQLHLLNNPSRNIEGGKTLILDPAVIYISNEVGGGNRQLQDQYYNIEEKLFSLIKPADHGSCSCFTYLEFTGEGGTLHFDSPKPGVISFC